MAKHTHAEIACTEAIFGGLASAVLAPFGYGQQNPPQQCPQDQVCPGINQALFRTAATLLLPFDLSAPRNRL